MLTSVRGLLAASFVVGCAMAATPAFADETDPPADLTVTGNVAMVTEYRFRGISLSNGDPAIQGAINVNHSSGLYAGVWGSNLEDSAVYGSVETDLASSCAAGAGAAAPLGANSANDSPGLPMTATLSKTGTSSSAL